MIIMPLSNQLNLEIAKLSIEILNILSLYVYRLEDNLLCIHNTKT